ncbi:MAG: Na+/H+ antiporter NhaC family protein [bacterium]
MRERRVHVPAAFLVLLVLAVAPVLGQSAGAEDSSAPGAGWLSVVPPVLAITLALVTRQVLVALVLGIWVGAAILEGNPFTAFLRVGDRYLVGALADGSHASIVLFSTTLGGMVGVLSRGGATAGIVHALRHKVGGRRGGMVATAAMGTVIFFDDYANTLLVGSTMRPLTDRLKISREKLAWLVDSTAAPVATVAVISTWVGFEVGLIQDAMAQLDRGGAAYTFFLQSIPFSFYPLLTLFFVYLISATGRDYGPMLKAERRALHQGLVLRPGASPASELPGEVGGSGREAAHPWLAGVPILAVIATTALGIYFGGRHAAVAQGIAQPSLREILNNADSFAVLMWSALIGATLAVAMTVGSRRLTLSEAMEGFIEGARAMLIAVVILILAWSLSAVCEGLDTAGFLVHVSSQVLSARLLPVVVFLLSAAVSFATGTSWGTMAILMPLVYPMGAQLPVAAGIAAGTAATIHLASVSAVLAGAVFGDHCSPISDTTIMSSLASGSDHVDHVRTQLPYAVTVAAVAALAGYLPAGFGVSPWISLGCGAILVALVVWRFGRAADQGEGPGGASS